MEDAPNLESVMLYFQEKIDMIYDLVPLVRLCNDQKRELASFCPSSAFTRKLDLTTMGAAYGEDPSLDISHLDESSAEGSFVPDLGALTEMVFEMKDLIPDIRDAILKQREDIDAQKERILSRVASLKDHVEYLKRNVPQFLRKPDNGSNLLQPQNKGRVQGPKVTANKGIETSKKVTTSQRTVVVANNKNVLKPRNVKSQVATNGAKVPGGGGGGGGKKAPEMFKNVPTIDFVTTDEFDSIPPYMRGRMVYETVNRAVADFNRTIAAKYRLLSTPSAKYSEVEMKRYQVYKSQENAETAGEFFCIIVDLKELSELKGDNNTKIALTCLRHCKRIKEIRGPTKLIRYAVVKKDSESAPNLD